MGGTGGQAGGPAERGVGLGGVLLKLRQQDPINVIHNSPFGVTLC
jgi:hypothetical protein